MKDKLKELTKDTAVYGISTIVGRFLGFLLVPFYTNTIGINDFGIYSNVYAYLAFLNILYIYGMDAAFLKYSSLASPEEKKNVFSTPFLSVIVSTLILSAFLLLFRSSFISLMEIPAVYDDLFYYLILILLFDTLALVPFANLRLQRKSVKFSVIKLLNILINLALNLILILKYKMGIEAIFISNLAASVFSFVVLIPDIFRNLKFKINTDILKKMLNFGLPYLPASLAAMIVQVIDRPVVLAMTDTGTLGVYQANYKLGIFMMLFVSMFQYAWQPFFLSNAKDKNAKEIFSKILTLFLLVAGFIWIILTLFVDMFAKFEIYHGRTIIGERYLGGLYIVPVVLLGYLFHGMYVNFQAGIYIEEKTKYFPVVTGLGAAVNVAVNIALIPVLNIMGAAIATLASYMVMATGLFLFSQKVYRINYEYHKIIKILALIFLTGGIYYFLYYTVGLTLLYKFLLLLVYSGSLLILNVVDLSELKKLGKILLRRN